MKHHNCSAVARIIAVYRNFFRQIIDRAEGEPWNFSSEDAAELARMALAYRENR